MGIIRLWAFIVLFAISSCAAGRIRSSYQVYPVRAPSAATSFAKLGNASAQIVTDSYSLDGDPPIRLTASDGTGLELQSLRVRTIIEGPLAFTELTMRFHNPRKRELEGRFEITLPDSAKVARLAMKLGSKWQEAEVVARRRAQEVYESYLHKQVDPVLLEASAGNRFRARVYPIPAGATKRSSSRTPKSCPRAATTSCFWLVCLFSIRSMSTCIAASGASASSSAILPPQTTSS